MQNPDEKVDRKRISLLDPRLRGDDRKKRDDTLWSGLKPKDKGYQYDSSCADPEKSSSIIHGSKEISVGFGETQLFQ